MVEAGGPGVGAEHRVSINNNSGSGVDSSSAAAPASPPIVQITTSATSNFSFCGLFRSSTRRGDANGNGNDGNQNQAATAAAFANGEASQLIAETPATPQPPQRRWKKQQAASIAAEVSLC